MCILYARTYATSVIVCIAAMTVPPTSEEYLSAVSGQKSHVGSSLRLLHEDVQQARMEQPAKGASPL